MLPFRLIVVVRRTITASRQPKVAHLAMLLGVSASSLTLLLAIAIYRRVTKYLKRMAPVDFMAQFDKMVAAGEISPEQVGKSQAPREIRRSAFTCLKQIGSGAFGEVRLFLPRF